MAGDILLAPNVDWGKYQERTHEPGGVYNTKFLNQYSNVIGMKEGLIQGCDMHLMKYKGMWYCEVSPGTLLKAQVIIEFTKSFLVPTGVPVTVEGSSYNPSTFPRYYFFCLEYIKLESDAAQPAKWVVLPENEVDLDNKHMKIFSIKWETPWTYAINQVADSFYDGDDIRVTHPETNVPIGMKEILEYLMGKALSNIGKYGPQGDPGKSAYQLAVEHGYWNGTLPEWIEFLMNRTPGGSDVLIIDHLNSTNKDAALSANMGRELDEIKMDEKTFIQGDNIRIEETSTTIKISTDVSGSSGGTAIEACLGINVTEKGDIDETKIIAVDFSNMILDGGRLHLEPVAVESFQMNPTYVELTTQGQSEYITIQYTPSNATPIPMEINFYGDETIDKSNRYPDTDKDGGWFGFELMYNVGTDKLGDLVLNSQDGSGLNATIQVKMGNPG